MKQATLVIMAAGIGSRFGGGIKQLEPVGPNGELIIDYSIYDALRAGFNKVVFIIRKDIEKEFKDVIGHRIEKLIEVEYVYQELNDIPAQYKEKLVDREKPWGTGQAVLCCRGVVKEPFVVINADDYYGREAYIKAYQYLTTWEKSASPFLHICMIGYKLKNTLSENGGVTRGVCTVDNNNNLENIREIPNIKKINKGAVICMEDECLPIDVETTVSMNMWGLFPEFFEILEKGFAEFLEAIEVGDLKKEYLLPVIIGGLVQKKEVVVKVLESSDEWFGVTYKEDKENVKREVRKLIESGLYIL